MVVIPSDRTLAQTLTSLIYQYDLGRSPGRALLLFLHLDLCLEVLCFLEVAILRAHHTLALWMSGGILPRRAITASTTKRLKNRVRLDAMIRGKEEVSERSRTIAIAVVVLVMVAVCCLRAEEMGESEKGRRRWRQRTQRQTRI